MGSPPGTMKVGTGITIKEKLGLVTSTKTVTVVTTVPEVPRTVNWARPPGAIAFSFNDTATTEIYALSLRDALPILGRSGKSMATVPAKPEIGTTVTERAMVSPGLTRMGVASVEGGFTFKLKLVGTTSTKTVAVLTTVPEVPRTVNWARPPGAIAATCTGKEPVAPAATFPGVAWKPAGKFGKSMNTVPAKPGPATTCTESARVPPGVTPMGPELVECGLTSRVKVLVTSTKTVTVCTEPGPKVPRTVNWVGPTGTVVATCTGKEPGSPTVTLPGVAWKPVGRLRKSMDTVPAKPEIGTTRTESCIVPPGVTGMGFELVDDGLTFKVKSLITFTKRVAVFTKPVPKVPRTVSSAGPGTAARVMCTGKEPVAPAATFPGVAWKPAGRFGKSMNTVPAKPVLGTTCTVRGSVMLCVTGAGALLVVAGFRLNEKSGCKTSAALTVAVMLPELSWPVMTSVKGCAPLKTVGAVVGANTVKLIVPVGPEGFGVNWTSTDCLPILPWPVKLMEPLKPPMGTTSNVPLTEPPKVKSVLKSWRLTIWKEGAVAEPKAKMHDPTFTPFVAAPAGQLAAAE